MQYLSSKDSNLFLEIFLQCLSSSFSSSSFSGLDDVLDLELTDVIVVSVEEDLLELLSEELEERGVLQRLLQVICSYKHI